MDRCRTFRLLFGMRLISLHSHNASGADIGTGFRQQVQPFWQGIFQPDFCAWSAAVFTILSQIACAGGTISQICTGTSAKPIVRFSSLPKMSIFRLTLLSPSQRLSSNLSDSSIMKAAQCFCVFSLFTLFAHIFVCSIGAEHLPLKRRKCCKICAALIF